MKQGRGNDSGIRPDGAANDSGGQSSGLQICHKVYQPGRASAGQADSAGFQTGPLKAAAGLQTGPDSTDPETERGKYKDKPGKKDQKEQNTLFYPNLILKLCSPLPWKPLGSFI